MERLSRLATVVTIGILVTLGLGVAPAAADTVNVTLTSRPAAAGSTVYLTAVVSPSPIGGEVRFESDQGLIDTAPVFFGKAEIWFVPRVSGTITVTATYTSFGGDTKGASAPLAITVGGGAIGSVTIDIATDTLLTVGKQAPLTATVTPTTGDGRVTFSVDGVRLAAVDVTRGQASTTWKPATIGQHTLSARYSGTAVDDAVASRVVVVMAQGGSGSSKADVIVVDPAGELSPWTPSASVTLANGTKRQLVASAASGAPVSLAVAGPCSLGNNVLRIDAGTNTCTLTAVSLGGNGFGPATQNYGIVLTPGVQQADLQAPPSGIVARRSAFVLGPVGQTTTLGQPLGWSVARGAKGVCTIVRAGGKVRLEVGARAGTCRVRAQAAGVPGQWNPYTEKRTYRAR